MEEHFADIKQSLVTGLCKALMKYDITRETIEQGLTEEQWDQIIQCAQEFSANCCQSIHNSVSVDFGTKMAKELKTKEPKD